MATETSGWATDNAAARMPAHATECACEFLKDGAHDVRDGVRLVSIYSRTDGVVDWRTCLVGPPADAIEVPASHIGLVMNSRVYEILADRLSLGEVRAAEEATAA
jgi:hypothetical protein